MRIRKDLCWFDEPNPCSSVDFFCIFASLSLLLIRQNLMRFGELLAYRYVLRALFLALASFGALVRLLSGFPIELAYHAVALT